MKDTDANVKGYAYSADALNELEATLSVDRFATYLAATGADREAAARLYTWNTAICAAFYGPLQALEIAVRNGMHRQLAKTYGVDWYDNPAAGLNHGANGKVAQARTELQRDGYPLDPPHIIASLSFGFWVSLLGKGGFVDRARTQRANYEMTLWRPALRAAFPHAASLNRAGAHTPLDFLRTFRNRIAHHEPIFHRHLQQDYQNILTVMSWTCPHKQSWMQAHCRVPELLALPPGDPAVRF
ncbi:hypothetical protein ACFOMH_18855 [Paracoccus mangrovi]|uniref:Abi-like protein n=1 Tax=Paracoccus mangrovi TaxID=1715645 RepID=A0ABV7R9X7_9RHOB